MMKWTLSFTSLFLGLSLFFPIFTASESQAQELQKVETSTGIYDIASPEDIHKFSAKEIRELVRMENGRNQGTGTIPHPILVHCFEEEVFHYAVGKYQNTPIKYRLHKPKNIRWGKKYPLIVHLHGIGEAGSNNTSQLVHLHSILPLLIGPERLDFFMLVVQNPGDDPSWHFNRSSKDGTLDVLKAVMDNVIAEYPINQKRISTTGVSSGGWGVWQLISKYPDVFASAVPTASGAWPEYVRLTGLKQTKIWSIISEIDTRAIESAQKATEIVNASGGNAALTKDPVQHHNSWMPAMEKDNCFQWMLAQKKGGWFTPPPGKIIRSPHSLPMVFILYVVPIAILALLFWERLRERD